MSCLRTLSAALLLLWGGCIEVEIPAEAGAGADGVPSMGTPAITPPDPTVTDGPDGSSLSAVDNTGTGGDDHVEEFQPCTGICDCPDGQDCINEVCRLGAEGAPLCCTKQNCPAGEPCWYGENQPGTCSDQQ